MGKDEATQIVEEIKALLDDHGVELINDDLRVKRQGGNWSVVWRISFKPRHSIEEG